MKFTLKKILAVLVAIIMTCSFIAGCGESKEKESTPATTQAESVNDQSETTATEPEEYKPKVDKLTIQTTNRVVPDGNIIHKWMEEELGIKLEFIIAGGDELITKLNLLVASNQTPDVMSIPSGNSSEYFKYVEQGVLADLDPLLQYAPNVLKARTTEQIEALRYKDGKLYAINSNTATGFDMLLLRQDWLKKVNLDVPTTIDELTEVMRAFVTKDPDGNGKNDTVGYQGWDGTGNFNAIWMAYGANPFQWILKDDTVVHGAMQPEVKEAVKYLRMLYQEGLMDKEYLTVDRTKVNERVSTGKVGMLNDGLWYASPNYSVFHQSPGASWIGIAPPKGPDGKSGYITGDNPIVRQFTCISSSSKDPIMAVKFLNFIADEANQLKIRAGDEGVHYTLVDGKVEYMEEYVKDSSLLVQMGITATYAMPFLIKDPYPPLLSKLYDECMKFYDIRFENEKDHYGAIYFPIPKILEEQLGDGWSDAYWKVINKLIIEGGDVDSEFDAVVKLIYDKYSMAKMEQYANDYYNEMKVK